jgi:two-component system response regulator NreC
MDPIRVLLAEDHETVRQGLRLLIDAQNDMAVVGEAGDGNAAIEAGERLHPHVIVMDVSMPNVDGLKATRTIRERAPETAVVALTRYMDEAYVEELLDAGAIGYVLKQSSSQELLAAIRSAAAGRRYLDSTLSDRAVRTPVRPRGAPVRRLSEREKDVLRMMALGHSNKEIASALDVSVKTVEVHKANAMRKLGLKGRIEVVRYAVLQGWLRDA